MRYQTSVVTITYFLFMTFLATNNGFISIYYASNTFKIVRCFTIDNLYSEIKPTKHYVFMFKCYISKSLVRYLPTVLF